MSGVDVDRFWMHPNADDLRLGAHVAIGLQGTRTLSVFWHGRASYRTTLEFFNAAAGRLSEWRRLRQPRGGTVTGPNNVIWSNNKTPLPPPTEDPAFIRFELVDGNPIGKFGEPLLVAWASLKPSPGETDTVGIFAQASDIQLLHNEISIFISETSRGRQSPSAANRLLQGLAEELGGR